MGTAVTEGRRRRCPAPTTALSQNPDRDRRPLTVVCAGLMLRATSRAVCMHFAAVGAAIGILAILAGDSHDDPLARHLHASP